MSISILYFARYREVLNCDKETLELNNKITTTAELIDFLSLRGDAWQTTLNEEKTLIAVNQTICTKNTALNSGDEVAFFPPVTGG